VDFDIYWTDLGIYSDRLFRMKPYQRINHFPGMFQLARKNNLGRNLMRMKKYYAKEYNFFPKTYLLPIEYGELRNQIAKKGRNKKQTFIVKPEASCQGKGIFLTNSLDDVDPSDHYVVQKYLNNPMLIDGLKFDLRIYALVISVDPLKIYLFKEGLSRFATEPFKTPSKKNFKNMFMHLTNYAINCKNKGKFIFNKGLEDPDIGHKKTFTYFLRYIEENYPDGEQKAAKVLLQIERIIIKTLCTV